jgi:hypothetical protein
MEKACETVGARSISDFARTAAIRLINSTDDTGETLKAKMSQIDQFLERIQWRVQAMAEGEAARPPLTSPAPAVAASDLPSDRIAG